MFTVCLLGVSVLCAVWGCKDNNEHSLETFREVVDLGSYSIADHIKDLEHEYDIVSFQEDGGYLLNAPGGELITVNADGKMNRDMLAPELLDSSGSAQSIPPDSKFYALDKAAWHVNVQHINRYIQVGGDDTRQYKVMSELEEGDTAKQLEFFWLSAHRLVGFGEYKMPCTTQSNCLQKGVRVFELGSDDKIKRLNIPIAMPVAAGESAKARLIGGFRVLADGSKCFWLWSAAGELLFVKSGESQSKEGKKVEWQRYKHTLSFSDPNIEIIEFDFDIAVAQGGGLAPPKYIAVIAKGANGKLALYTALPD